MEACFRLDEEKGKTTLFLLFTEEDAFVKEDSKGRKKVEKIRRERAYPVFSWEKRPSEEESDKIVSAIVKSIGYFKQNMKMLVDSVILWPKLEASGKDE